MQRDPGDLLRRNDMFLTRGTSQIGTSTHRACGTPSVVLQRDDSSLCAHVHPSTAIGTVMAGGCGCSRSRYQLRLGLWRPVHFVVPDLNSSSSDSDSQSTRDGGHNRELNRILEDELFHDSAEKTELSRETLVHRLIMTVSTLENQRSDRMHAYLKKGSWRAIIADSPRHRMTVASTRGSENAGAHKHPSLPISRKDP